MAVSIVPNNQIRYNDPYTQRIFQYQEPAELNKYYLAREVNNLLKIYGDRILKGLHISLASVDPESGDLTLTIEKGVAIVDSTLIFINEDVNVTYPGATNLDLLNGYFAVFLNYQWLYTLNNNPLKITAYYVNSSTGLPEAGFDPTRDRVFVGYVVVDDETLDVSIYCGVDDKIVINGEIYYVGCARGVEQQPFESYIDNAISSDRLFVNLTNKIKQASSLIEKPTIVSPTAGQYDFGSPIQASPYRTVGNFYGCHEATDWEVATDENFENIVVSSYNDPVNLTSYVPSGLQPLTTYYVRVRYRSDYHISPWSDPVEFTTPEAYIETPVISCSTGNSLYPGFTLSPFIAYGYTDNWQSTEWQIATDSNFENIIRTYVEINPDFKDTWVINDNLLNINSVYYVRARYNGDHSHVSNWSSPYVLETGLYQIEFSIPPQANEQDVLNIHVTHDNGREFDTSQYTLHGSVTHGSLSISGMDVNWTLPNVSQDTTASITLWVTRNSDSTDVTEHETKSLTVKDVVFVSDSAVIITDFSQYDYNDLWDTTII